MERDQRLQRWGLEHQPEMHKRICRKIFVKLRIAKKTTFAFPFQFVLLV
jgi:hypothetical protein